MRRGGVVEAAGDIPEGWFLGKQQPTTSSVSVPHGGIPQRFLCSAEMLSAGSISEGWTLTELATEPLMFRHYLAPAMETFWRVVNFRHLCLDQ
jgi:hypothetical protein